MVRQPHPRDPRLPGPYVGAGKNLRVLDIGCGAGNMAHHLAHYGQVVGVDLYAKPLEVARQRGLEVHEGAADDLPFDDQSFDLVTLLDVVEHVPNEHGVLANAVACSNRAANCSSPCRP